MPIRLSDRQSLAVTSAAAALAAADRDGFYAAVAHQLAGHERFRWLPEGLEGGGKGPVWTAPSPITRCRWDRDRPRFEHASKRSV